MALSDKPYIIRVNACGEWHYGDVVAPADVLRVFGADANITRLINLGALEQYSPTDANALQIAPIDEGNFPGELPPGEQPLPTPA